MNRRLLASLFLGAFLLLPGCLDSSSDGSASAGPGQMSPTELAWAQQVLDLVNVERANASLPPLAWHDPVSQVAYEHSVDMDVRNFFSHTNPDGDGPADRITMAGITWTAAGENIAYGQQTPAVVMTDWMNSPGHRANILSPNYTHLGVGVHLAPGGPWWTQNFMAP